jgi:hypothetical protein
MTSPLTHPTVTTPTDRTITDPMPRMLGALCALLVANGVQVAAGLAQLDLSPPEAVLPLLGATIAIGVAAVPMIRAGQRLGIALGLLVCALSLIGMGPHKLLVDDGLAIAPLALTGFAFEIVFAHAAIRTLRERT